MRAFADTFLSRELPLHILINNGKFPSKSLQVSMAKFDSSMQLRLFIVCYAVVINGAELSILAHLMELEKCKLQSQMLSKMDVMLICTE